MKTIVTHIAPDLDAIASSWLIKSYLPGWNDASMEFVPAGSTLNDIEPDDDPNIIHVDTGLGKFDHHQLDDNKVSATKRVFDHLEKNDLIRQKDLAAVSRIVDYVTLIDHFGEVNFHDPTSDIYEFNLHRLIEGLKATGKNYHDVCAITFENLNAASQIFKNKIKAEEEVEKGFVFDNKWGKSLAMETSSEDAVKLALKMKYKVVIRKDPERGNVRIKTQPEKEIDLTPIYERVKKLDPEATWFFHISKHMLLNGSSKNPKSVPSKLPLKKVIEIIQSI